MKSLEIFPNNNYEPIKPEELELEYAPKNNPSKIVIPKNTEFKEKKNEIPTEAIDLSRRKFLMKGATAVLGISAIATAEKAGVFGKALKSMTNVFDRLKKREEDAVNEVSPEANTVPAPPETIKTEIEIKNIADHYLKAHDSLVNNVEFFPRGLFSDDFLLAQEIQESGCDIDARSTKGAVGLMQTMEISLKDNSLFLERLHNNNVLDYDGPIYIGDIEKNIKELRARRDKLAAKKRLANRPLIKDLNLKIEENKNTLAAKKKKYGDRVLKEIDLISLEKWNTHDPKYSRAQGELYLMRLYNKDYGYGAGNDEFNKDLNIKAAQTEILGAYNAGYDHVNDKPIEKWYEEPRTYVKRIFNLMDRAKNVREALAQNGLDDKNNELVKFITLELNKVTTSGNKRQEVLSKSMNYLVELIKNRENELGKRLEKKEIEKIRDDLSDLKEINENTFYT